MVEATVVMKDGTTYIHYANSFEQLFKFLENKDIKEVAGRTIKPSELRQGKERLQT